MNLQLGQFMAERLAKALGLEGMLIERIVIDCAYDEVARVYIQRLLGQSEADLIVDALKDARGSDFPHVIDCSTINVDERGRVTATPRE